MASEQRVSGLSIAMLVVGAVGIKALLGVGYKSTDFEVHRNWMAVTSSLPLGQWYTDTTSASTLDYPPLFAWFERILALGAAAIEPSMVRLQPDAYDSPACTAFQRATVIASDSVLVAGVLLYASTWAVPGTSTTNPSASGGRVLVALGLALLNGGLLIVDSVHFQYNGMLLGVLALTLACWRAGWPVLGAVSLTCLVLLKHLFLVLGPLALLLLLRAHVAGGPMRPAPFAASQLVLAPAATAPAPGVLAAARRFAQLGAAVLAVLALVLGPFLATTGPADGAKAYDGALPAARQIASRLFPVSRGLTHTFWAPNAWALYRAADCAGARTVLGERCVVATRGVLADGASSAMQLLPEVSAGAAAALTLAAMLPALLVVWRRPNARLGALAAAQCALSAFLFGWHVHEKAALAALLPLGLAAAESPDAARAFIALAGPALSALCPLLFGVEDRLVGLALVAAFVLGACWALQALHGVDDVSLTWLGGAGFAASCVWAAWPLIAAALGRGEAWMPFLPLMAVSCTCAVGVVWSWADLSFRVLPAAAAALAAPVEGGRAAKTKQE